MFGSEILEVAIGLVFVFLVASTACSAIREGIAKLLNTRAKNLEKELLDLLKSSKLVENVYQHQLIREPQDKDAKKKPKKISGDKFSTALVDVLLRAEDDGKGEFEELKNSIAKIENIPIRNKLLDILNTAAGDVDKLKEKVEEVRKTIEDWYDKLTDKLSAWYTKRSREMLFVIGLIVCGLLNLDTVMLVKNLYTNDTLRESVAVAAVESIKTKPVDPADEKSLLAFTEEINNLRAKIDETGIPIGWAPKGAPQNDPRRFPKEPLQIILKILGLLATSLAISFGAPFWFDTMKKLAELSARRKKNVQTNP